MQQDPAQPSEQIVTGAPLELTEVALRFRERILDQVRGPELGLQVRRQLIIGQPQEVLPEGRKGVRGQKRCQDPFWLLTFPILDHDFVGPKRVLTPFLPPLRKAWRSLGSPTPDTAPWGSSPDIPVWREGDRTNERGRLVQLYKALTDSFMKPFPDGGVHRPYTPAHLFGAWHSFLPPPKYGHIFDHHSVVYEYANGVKLFSACRQQDGCDVDVTDHVFGTQGTCDVMKYTIKGAKPWRYSRTRDRRGDGMYQNEHNELIACIRSGKPINNGDYMTKSTLMAIMGRMATYTGKTITWQMALNSKEDLRPPKYEFGPLPVPPVAKPGVTKFA